VPGVGLFQLEHLVYRNDGLAVGWMLVPARRQLDVEVWQIYVNGKKPGRLPGARDDLIDVRMENGGTNAIGTER
jgi:hypothetical protein